MGDKPSCLMRLLEFLFNFVRFAWNVFAIGLLIGIFITAMFGVYLPPPPPIHSPYSVITNTLKLTETWRVSNLSLGTPRSIEITPHCIVVVKFLKWGSSLICLSFENGTTNWGNIIEHNSVLAHDLNNVYTAAPNNYIKAYNLETGDLIWNSGIYLFDRRSHLLNLQNNILFNHVIKDGNEYIYQVNPTTGELISEETIPIPNDDFPEFIMRLGDIDLRQNFNYLFKVSHQTGDTLWQVKLNNLPNQYKFYKVKYFPILTHNTLIAMVNRSVRAIDFNTGQDLWVNEGPFVSNMAFVQDKIYVLSKDARLVTLEATTGHELGYVQFSQLTSIEGLDPYPVIDYWVGADEQGKVFVYFSDSDELIGLAPLEGLK